MKSPPFGIVVLISGEGSNLQSIIDATDPNNIKGPLKHCKVNLVVSNKSNAYGLVRAQNFGIISKVKVWDKTTQSREDYDMELAQLIKSTAPGVDLIVCAGWMHILSEKFINEFPPSSVISLHPSLPEQYIGLRAIENAYYDYKNGMITETGCMVHTVTPVLDYGKYISIRKFSMKDIDSLEKLKERMHAEEHIAIVEAIRLLSLNEFLL